MNFLMNTIPRLGVSKEQLRVLAVLTSVNFINFVDRQIIFALIPLIQLEFSVSYAQVGLVGTIFSLVHSLSTCPLGVLADRTSRKKVIMAGMVFWSVATFLTGLVTAFRNLIIARGFVGLGEAAYTPAGTAIITGSFHRSQRARVQGIFDAGMFMGGAAGLALGSLIGSSFGWRPAFYLVAIPGLLLAVAVGRLREPSVERERPVPLRDLLRIPAYRAVLVGGWFITFAAYSFIFWGPTFVMQHKGFDLREAGLVLGGILTLAGVCGIVVGAALADRMMRLVVWGRVFIIATGLLLGVPLLLGALHTNHRGNFLELFFAAVFFLSWYHGPLTAVLHDLTPPRAHATAVALYGGFVHLFAVTWASLIIGAVSDRYGLYVGMHVALSAHFIGALCFLGVIPFVRRHSVRNARGNTAKEAKHFRGTKTEVAVDTGIA